jgi:hypothetical protein
MFDRMSRRPIVAIALLATTAALTAPLVVTTNVQAATGPASVISLNTLVRNSPPSIGDVDGDGTNDVVFGGEDGIVRVFRSGNFATPLWQSAAVPATPPGCRAQSTPTAVDSMATIADVDGDGANEVIAGMGSTYRPGQNGGLVVFNRNGSVKWKWNGAIDVFNVFTGGGKDGLCEGVISAPAVGDVDGDGDADVVFGSWDHRIVALDGRTGAALGGFPYDIFDTIWSSPALFDIDSDGVMEIFIGGDDSCCWNGHKSGGQFHALSARGGRATVLWRKVPDEVLYGSPAIGDINGDGRMELVISTGNYYQNRDSRRLYAWHLDDGSTVPGWPVEASGVPGGSPALGDIDGDGVSDVVIGALDAAIYAWNGQGRLLWRTAVCCNPAAPSLNRVLGSPVIVDLDGDGDNDVAAASSWTLQFHDGRTGAKLGEGGVVGSSEGSPAVGDFGGAGRRLFGSAYDLGRGTTQLFSLPLAGSSAMPWPGFRAFNRGVVATTVAPSPGRVNRLSGADRIATSVAISASAYGPQGARGAVITRSDAFADALVGAPLARRSGGPLLLTPTASLDARVEAELRRVLAPGATVYALGGEAALSKGVTDRLGALGFRVERLAGADRYATSVEIAKRAEQSGGPIFVANGTQFPDALIAGSASASVSGVTVLTRGGELPAVVETFLRERGSASVVAVGAEATQAVPSARSISGATPSDTSVLVAQAFTPSANAIGFASSEAFPDALSGGAHVGSLGGTLILVPKNSVPASVLSFVSARKPSTSAVYAYGGVAALTAATISQLGAAL